MSASPIELALGPCLFNWPAERMADFYARIADEAPVERVYVGEVVCGKRMPFTDPIWPDAIERLRDAGKTVVYSALAQPSSRRERNALTLQAAYDLPIEINDMSMLPARSGRSFTAGPLLNCYNEACLTFLAARGATDWCPPVELPLSSIRKIAALVPEVGIELFAFGRLPLALSSRCYHARSHGLTKDSCQFVCDRDPDGMAVTTVDGQRFLAANGIQTLSDSCQVAALAPDHLEILGISRLRLSPHSTDMVRVASLFRQCLDREIAPDELEARLEETGLPGPICNAYLNGDAGWKKEILSL
ncbi:ubiquinone anaerobic biosynthesis protein UbiV [Roseibium aggregatum]|uniref:Ubiquinone biosynthesis protein UbiV n=1 Tax=Roseibium aggregatum TaxID=187304 RepID=A0A926P0B8_9HYPH|nr:U32 family peptidase [Roseibium aggregatum]MBD1549724.1 U32 family peptidase [Roseibium aggregatum]